MNTVPIGRIMKREHVEAAGGRGGDRARAEVLDHERVGERHHDLRRARQDHRHARARATGAGVPPATSATHHAGNIAIVQGSARGEGRARGARARRVAVAMSNPTKVYFPKAGITKLELVQYYLAVAEGALRGVARRPRS